MITIARGKFIAIATASYAGLGIAWILLSDQLLAMLADSQSMVWLSAVKGIFFIGASAVLIFFALRAVPNSHPADNGSLLRALAADELADTRPLGRSIAFAIFISIATLVVREHMPLSLAEHPLLVIFIFPIILSAFVGGLWPGLLATLILVAGANYLSISPLYSMAIDDISDLFHLAFLLINGVAISLLSEIMRGSLRRMEFHHRLVSTVFSGTSDAVFVKDLHGRYLMVNDAAAAFIGRSGATILGCDDRTLFSEEVGALLMAKDKSIMEDGITRTDEEFLVTREGRALVFLVTKGPMFNKAGKVCGLFGISRDITLRKQFESDLRRNEAAMRSAQRLAGAGSWEWKVDTNEHHWSEEIYAIYGRDPELGPAVYPEVQKYFTPESWQQLAHAIDTALKTGNAYTCDAEVVRPDGSRRWIITRGEVGRDLAGRLVEMYGSVQDITERKLDAVRVQQSEERLRYAIEATSDGLWDYNLQTGVVYRSPRYYEIVGCSESDASPDFDFFTRLLHPDDLADTVAQIDAHRRQKTPYLDLVFRIRTLGGELKWIRSRGRTVAYDADGASVRMVGTLVDVTEEKVARAALQEREQQLARVIDGSDQGYWDWNLGTNKIEVSARWETMLGYQPGEMQVSPDCWSDYVHPDDLALKLTSVSRHLNGETQSHHVEIRCRSKAGEWRWILARGRVVRWNEDGSAAMMSGTHTDISERKLHENELERVAHYDSLTGLPNRHLLADRMAQAVVHATRTGKTLAVCFLDLDDFKAINDQYGRELADRLLLGVTANLRNILRGEDTLARLGGDEFALLMTDVGSSRDCAQILERVLAAVRRPVQISGVDFSITASIGVSLYPEDRADQDALLRHADHAMYLAKQAGKNRFHLFDPENDRKAQEHRLWLEHLGEAMAQDQFVLFYQPKVDLRSGAVIGAEALIRWRHPERGLLAPAQFLPHVNGSPLEIPFGEWVIESALKQAAAWARTGLAPVVSVNISAAHLLQEGFVDKLAAALQRYPAVAPANFELEVLETAALSDMDQAVAILRACKALGVRFALDDFGTGYSSLTYLRKLPVDILKIDQSFVRDMLDDGEDLGIVEGVIRLARAFGREVIAEGVETPEHGAALVQLGCHLAQGYGIARPMPAADFFSWTCKWEAEHANSELGETA